jgi:hypothetical protein
MTITTTSTNWRDTIRGRYQDTETHRYYSVHSSYDGFSQIWILKQATTTKGKKVTCVAVIHEEYDGNGYHLGRGNNEFTNLKQAERQIPGIAHKRDW